MKVSVNAAILQSVVTDMEVTIRDSKGCPRTLSFAMGDGYEVDITAVPPESDEVGYFDPVLFKDGHEVCTCDISEELLGEYHFYAGEDEFVLSLKEEA